jgi:hypothetical protein
MEYSWRLLRNLSDRTKGCWLAAGLSLFGASVFYVTTKATLNKIDYSGWIALALLHGHLGLETHPSSQLDKMGPWMVSITRSFPLVPFLELFDTSQD